MVISRSCLSATQKSTKVDLGNLPVSRHFKSWHTFFRRFYWWCQIHSVTYSSFLIALIFYTISPVTSWNFNFFKIISSRLGCLVYYAVQNGSHIHLFGHSLSLPMLTIILSVGDFIVNQLSLLYMVGLTVDNNIV